MNPPAAKGNKNSTTFSLAIKNPIIPPSKDDDPDFYLDYGSDTSYHTKTGKGECAA